MSHTQVYKADIGEWRWRVRAGNHEDLGISNGSYLSRTAALHGLALTAEALAAHVGQLQSLHAAGAPASQLQAEHAPGDHRLEIEDEN